MGQLPPLDVLVANERISPVSGRSNRMALMAAIAVALDMYEHAYHMDFGAKAAA